MKNDSASFRAFFSRSFRVVSRLFPFVQGRFAPIPIRPCLCLSYFLIGITNWKIIAIN